MVRVPEWVCDFCGQSFGRKACDEDAVWHQGACDVCDDDDIQVTRVQAFGGLYDHWKDHD